MAGTKRRRSNPIVATAERRFKNQNQNQNQPISCCRDCERILRLFGPASKWLEQKDDFELHSTVSTAESGFNTAKSKSTTFSLSRLRADPAPFRSSVQVAGMKRHFAPRIVSTAKSGFMERQNNERKKEKKTSQGHIISHRHLKKGLSFFFFLFSFFLFFFFFSLLFLFNSPA